MTHKFDLEKRTTDFAKETILLCRKLPKDPINNRLAGQIVGSSGSIGANYREANDALGKKDFTHRLKISRKEIKETIHWFDLIGTANPSFKDTILPLTKEAIELRNIFSAIIKKCDAKQV